MEYCTHGSRYKIKGNKALRFSDSLQDWVLSSKDPAEIRQSAQRDREQVKANDKFSGIDLRRR